MAAQERQFVIVTPHQSVGSPGTTVFASRLGMSDEQLDDWVDAGHATEIHQRRQTAPVTKVSRKDDGDDDGASKDQ